MASPRRIRVHTVDLHPEHPTTIRKVAKVITSDLHLQILQWVFRFPHTIPKLQAYQIGKPVGAGTFAVVWEASNTLMFPGKKLVAKILRTAKTSEQDDWWIPSLSELASHLWVKQRSDRDLAHVARLVDVFLDTKWRPVLVYEKFNSDLMALVRAQPQFKEWCVDRTVRLSWMKQIMHGLQALHSVGIMHRDLTPNNILVRRDADDLPQSFDLCIGDLGAARPPFHLCAPDRAGHLSEYITTRWYRAPEVSFGRFPYDEKVDIWAAGIIFYLFLSGGKQLMPSDSAQNHCKYLVGMLGKPTPEEQAYYIPNPVEKPFDYPCNSATLFEQLAAAAKPNVFRPRLELTGASKDELDLLQQMLTYRPLDRLSAKAIVERLDYMSTDTPTPLASPKSPLPSVLPVQSEP